MKALTLILLSYCILSNAYSQQKKTWNGKQAAVVLTYDDGLDEHLSNVVPALDSLGLKGTFYISDYLGHLSAQAPLWRAAAAAGHELGNHTRRHPCAGGRPGREFVKPDNDLNKLSVQQVTTDILSLDSILMQIDGEHDRTFAYPCGDMTVNDTAYLEELHEHFIGARGVASIITTADSIELYNLPGYGINGHTGEQMINLVKQAIEKKGLLVLLFHGVGGGHSLDVSLNAHRELLHFLKQHEQKVWTATMLDVVQYIKE